MQVLKTQLTAKSKGYSDVVYLDAVENKYVEEVSSCNIFMVKVCDFIGLYPAFFPE
jgi:branched-chain amino acid aminotransferase